MKTTTLVASAIAALSSLRPALAYCDDPSPAFPLPEFERDDPELLRAAERMQTATYELHSRPEYAATLFSVEVTSSQDTLFGMHATAFNKSMIRPGAPQTNNATAYRIASMTKPFTVLAILQLHKAGKLRLDDTVLEHLPELGGTQDGSLPWKDVTLRALASQIAGLPRDFGTFDLLGFPGLTDQLGLPPVKLDGLPQCDFVVNYTRACTADDMIPQLRKMQPLFAPNQKSSYSNINYSLLGLVIAKVANTTYEDYITENILKPLNMTHAGFQPPSDEYAAIPAGMENYWPVDLAVNNPTGGMYASSSDMAKFLRHVLTTYNAQTHALNWLQPTSWSGSMQTFYGIPWETFVTSTANFLPSSNSAYSTRPIPIVTKGGGLPGYTSNNILIPTHNLGITVLVAGEGKAMSILRDIAVSIYLEAATNIVLRKLRTKYAGTYMSNNLNTTAVLSVSSAHALTVEQFISNGTDVLDTMRKQVDPDHGANVTFFLTPTLLYANEKEQKGEIFRLGVQPPATPNNDPLVKGVFDNFCVADVDAWSYGGKPVNQIVFWKAEDGQYQEIELTGYRIALRRNDREHGDHDGRKALQQPLMAAELM